MAGLVSICCCAGGRLMSLGRPSPSLLLIVLFWRVWKWYGSCLSVVAIMVGLRLLGRPSAYCSIHLSSCQDTYPKARGSASIYFSSQGWSAHVFKKNLRPGNVSTALLHLAFLFSLLIVIFLKALNVVGLVPICRCKGGRCMSFKGAFGLVHFPFLVFSSWDERGGAYHFEWEDASQVQFWRLASY